MLTSFIMVEQLPKMAGKCLMYDCNFHVGSTTELSFLKIQNVTNQSVFLTYHQSQHAYEIVT